MNAFNPNYFFTSIYYQLFYQKFVNVYLPDLPTLPINFILSFTMEDKLQVVYI